MKPKRFIPIILISILLSACSSILSTPEPTVLPVESVQPTQKPEPTRQLPTIIPTAMSEGSIADTPEPEPTEEVVLQNESFRLEEFENDISGWSWFITSGSEDKTQIYRDRGRVVFELIDKDIYAYLMYDDYTYTDVKISTSVENRGKTPTSVSLICRYEQNSGWYEFNIGSDGLYTILRYDGTLADGEYVFLVNGGSNQIRTGREFNNYAVSCEGETLTLWINDIKTKTIDDSVLTEGKIGISASSYNVTPIIVEFDYVDISLPENE
ncbi:MAG: hypothetical protein CL609_02985 [Anaerolineaceae bacterium]|nr:hypothetical protein [Anaerolineaceae bacterium]